MAYIEIKSLSKTIKGKVILKNVCLSLEKGKIYGLIGENGSGKTMLMRTLLGLVSPNEGSIKIAGIPIYPGKPIPCNVGVMIENNSLWPELSAFENLKVLSKIKKKTNDSGIREAIARVGLDPNSKKAFSKFSLGMKQRLVLAQAIMEMPDVLVLDEPTNSLDDDGVELLKKIITEEKKRGCLILISSHSPELFDGIWDEVITVKSGVFSMVKERDKE